MFNIISIELDINGNVFEILEKNFDYTNKQRKIKEDEYDSQFIDYRENEEEERTEHNIKTSNKLPITKNYKKLYINDVLMDFDATSLYPSAMWDENSV